MTQPHAQGEQRQAETEGWRFTPFATGYTEAMRQSLPVEHRDAPLAPATLSLIVGDCDLACDGVSVTISDAESGREFWLARQTGRLTASRRFHAFPSLAPYRGEHGFVHLLQATDGNKPTRR